MSSPTDNLTTVRRYLKTIEDGIFADIADLFTPDMVMEQFPNRVYPQGLRGTLSQMSDGFERGRKLLSHQTYEIKNALANNLCRCGTYEGIRKAIAQVAQKGA